MEISQQADKILVVIVNTRLCIGSALKKKNLKKSTVGSLGKNKMLLSKSFTFPLIDDTTIVAVVSDVFLLQLVTVVIFHLCYLLYYPTLTCEYNIAQFPFSRKVNSQNLHPENKISIDPSGGTCHQVAAPLHPDTGNNHSSSCKHSDWLSLCSALGVLLFLGLFQLMVFSPALLKCVCFTLHPHVRLLLCFF